MAKSSASVKSEGSSGFGLSGEDGTAQASRKADSTLDGSTGESSLQDSPHSSEDSVKKGYADNSATYGRPDASEGRRMRLSLPSAPSHRGSVLFGVLDDDLTNLDSMSDSTTSQLTIPEVPMTQRSHNASLAEFYRLLARNTAILEDSTPSGSSPPASMRDAHSNTPQSSPHQNHRTPMHQYGGNMSARTFAAPTIVTMPASPRDALMMSNAASEGEISNTVTKARITALEWLIASTAGSRTATLTLDQALRNRDLSDQRRPYERLIRMFIESTSETLVANSLDLINMLLGDISGPRRIQLFNLLSNTRYLSNLNLLLLSEKVGHRIIAKNFQGLFLENLLWQASLSWDPRDPIHALRLAHLLKTTEPILTFNSSVWENCSLLSFNCCCYFAEHYPSLIRQLLDENESQTPDTYCLPLIAPHLVIILNELATASSPYAFSSSALSGANATASYNSTPTSSSEWDCTDSQEDSMDVYSESKTKESGGNGMLPILFSQEDAYYEVFSMTLVIFDSVWKDSAATLDVLEKALAKTKHLISISAEASFDCRTLHDQLQLNMSKQNSSKSYSLGSNGSSGNSFSGKQRSTPSVPSLALPSQSSHTNASGNNSNAELNIWRTPVKAATPLELRIFFIELVHWVSAPIQDISQLSLLTDAVCGMRALASLPGFPWDVATPALLFHMLRNVAATSDNSWVRQPMLSGQVALWIDFQLNADPRGPSKMIEALEMIAGDHSEGYCHTKPLVRMLRSNRQMAIPLRIINCLFEFHTDDADRHAYLLDLARSQALPVMKSKVWSTYADVKTELFRFQRNLLSLTCATKFDPSNRDHESMLNECWHLAFPLIKLKHVSFIQWAVLGFRKCVALSSFRGMRLVGLQHLLHFIKTQHAVTQHFILCSQPGAPALGDTALAVSNMLIRFFTSGENLMPMIFDRDGLAEIHRVVTLWLLQTWLIDLGCMSQPLPNSTSTVSLSSGGAGFGAVTGSSAAGASASNLQHGNSFSGSGSNNTGSASSSNTSTATTEALVLKAENRLLVVLKNNKPSTADELMRLMGVSEDAMTKGWTKLMERLNPGHFSSALSAPQSSDHIGGRGLLGGASPVPHSSSSRHLVSHASSTNLLSSTSSHHHHHSTSSPLAAMGIGSAHDQTSVNKLKKMLGGTGDTSNDNTLMMSINASVHATPGASSTLTPPTLARSRSRRPSAAPTVVQQAQPAAAQEPFIQEPDYLVEYLTTHSYEMRLREHELALYIDEHLQDVTKRGRQRGSSRAERELIESERISRTFAATKMSLAPEPILPLPDDDKQVKEVIKQRKAEAKEQKEVKAALVKQKVFRA